MLGKLKAIAKAYNILIQDWLRYEFSPDALKYLRIKNRMERLGLGPIPGSYVCLWPYTSELGAATKWPFVGRKILKRVLRDNKFLFTDTRVQEENVEVSIIIGHRGLERLELLLATLSSLASQEGVSLECIVVEQDVSERIRGDLPGWVNYFFQKAVGGKERYNRSAAFNFGARHARGRILLLHDNDMIVPSSYCADIVRLANNGYEALNTKRYVFYLNKSDTMNFVTSRNHLPFCTPISIVQNLEAGGSMAITRKGFFEIGGMDEDFVGWGGEDNEFWRRCSVLRRWIWGFSPIIHLWHESQPLKNEKINENVERAKALGSVSIEERIEYLSAVNRFAKFIELD